VPNRATGFQLRGREQECRKLEGLLTAAKQGASQVLLVRGNAGVGKTALLKHLAQAASGGRVVQVAGIEYEKELTYGALHQLCNPFLHLREHLPAPQREALETTFGLNAKPPPDRFIVGLATLGLLAEAADEQPLVCLVDDAQWLDTSSALTIAFIARRLLAEPITMVIAVREHSESFAFDGLPELFLTGLDEADAQALLDGVWPGQLDKQVRKRVLAEAQGNPLALLELPRSLTSSPASQYEPSEWASPSEHIEASFRHQFDLLAPETQMLLITAAAEPVGDLNILLRATSRLGIAFEAVTPAQRAGLIELDPVVRFRHPLVRSAVYRAATPAQRREVHAALADATDADADPDRRAWHRGLATLGPDETVAEELINSAGRARARGGVATAAAFLERATELTKDPPRRGTRALAAAEAKAASGALEAALRLCNEAELCPLGDEQRVRLTRLRAQIVFARSRGKDAPTLLLDAAAKLEVHDAAAARDTYLEALGAAVYAGRLSDETPLAAIAAAAREAPSAGPVPRPSDLLLDGLVTRFTRGYQAGMAPLRRALDAFVESAETDEEAFIRWFWLPWLVAGDLWEDQLWRDLAVTAVRLCRGSGALTALPVALGYLAAVEVHAGEFASAAALVDEADQLSAAIGQARVGYPSSLLMAWQGDEERALEFSSWGLGDALSRGEGRAQGGVGLFRAIFANSHSEFGAALGFARQVCEFEDLILFGPALVELIEAAVRLGELQEASAALRQLEERTRASGTDWALGLEARCRALLSEGKTAEAWYRESVERLARSRVTVHLGRSRLMYGEWLAKQGRRAEARSELHYAHELFAKMGAIGFAERARRQRAAIGDVLVVSEGAPLPALTPQEAQVARLAREGLTNAQIGAQLFISRHTVDWHLRKVFAKLSITSRTQLAGLPSDRFRTKSS
jgi:DNA-binding CsgD family transcriptional regulator